MIKSWPPVISFITYLPDVGTVWLWSGTGPLWRVLGDSWGPDWGPYCPRQTWQRAIDTWWGKHDNDCIYNRLSISRSCGDYSLQVQITRSANWFALWVIWTCKKSIQCLMVGESNQHVFLIQIDASSFAEFKISVYEISRFDCTVKPMKARYIYR